MNTKPVSIVTGGTRGMGAEISLKFAENGYNVVAVYVSNDESANKLIEELQKVSSEFLVIKADVSDKSGVNKVIEETIKLFGRIDVLVNNAGIFDFTFVEEMEEEQLNKMFNVNFKSQFLMTKACIKYMKENEFGRVLNASSISGKIADVGLVGYGASKAAVNMLTKITAAELAPYNITVNAYAPGIIHTDLTDSMIQERGKLQVKQIPLNRFGTSEEIASLLLFLASKEAGYITGEIIGIDGGMFKVQNPYRAHEHKNNN